MGKKKETQKKTGKTIQPTKLPLDNLLEYKTDVDKMYIETIELAMAADALDECLRRQFLTQLWDFLQKRGAEQAVVKEEDVKWQQDRTERKRKRDEDADSRKKVRAEKEAEVKKQWKTDDAGLTDDERRALQPGRDKELASLWKDEDTQLRKELAEEMKRDAARIRVDDDGQEYTMKNEPDQESHDAFQFFDRTVARSPAAGGGAAAATTGCGFLARARLEDLFLCLDAEPTPQQVSDLIAANGGRGDTLQYLALCGMRRKVLVPKPKVDTPKKAATPKKEAAVAEQEGNEC